MSLSRILGNKHLPEQTEQWIWSNELATSNTTWAPKMYLRFREIPENFREIYRLVKSYDLARWMTDFPNEGFETKWGWFAPTRRPWAVPIVLQNPAVKLSRKLAWFSAENHSEIKRKIVWTKPQFHRVENVRYICIDTIPSYLNKTQPYVST